MHISCICIPYIYIHVVFVLVDPKPEDYVPLESRSVTTSRCASPTPHQAFFGFDRNEEWISRFIPNPRLQNKDFTLIWRLEETMNVKDAFTLFLYVDVPPASLTDVEEEELAKLLARIIRHFTGYSDEATRRIAALYPAD